VSGEPVTAVRPSVRDMAYDPADLPEPVREFLRERHLATLTTLRPDGTPHVVAVGFTWDDDARLVRVITSGTSTKARNVAHGSRRAVVAQVDGRRWLSLEGVPVASDDPERVAEAVRRYAERYRQPRENPARVVVEIAVDRVLGSV
jgi:F420H(2)-dependent biliverdin reductase